MANTLSNLPSFRGKGRIRRVIENNHLQRLFSVENPGTDGTDIIGTRSKAPGDHFRIVSHAFEQMGLLL